MVRRGGVPARSARASRRGVFGGVSGCPGAMRRVVLKTREKRPWERVGRFGRETMRADGAARSEGRFLAVCVDCGVRGVCVSGVRGGFRRGSKIAITGFAVMRLGAGAGSSGAAPGRRSPGRLGAALRRVWAARRPGASGVQGNSGGPIQRRLQNKPRTVRRFCKGSSIVNPFPCTPLTISKGKWKKGKRKVGV